MSENVIFMDTKSVAELLHVKIETIYSWLHYKQIPNNIYRKLGRKAIFIREEVIKWIYDVAEILKRKDVKHLVNMR